MHLIDYKRSEVSQWESDTVHSFVKNNDYMNYTTVLYDCPTANHNY